jgi:hypothetical protein
MSVGYADPDEVQLEQYTPRHRQADTLWKMEMIVNYFYHSEIKKSARKNSGEV